jgi:S1-C subfamily serine protease
VTPQGPHPFGGGPDDPDGGEDQGGALGETPDDGAEDELDETTLKGWLPPDDRLWRHPSEVLATPSVAEGGRGLEKGSAYPVAVPVGSQPHRRRNIATALVGTGVAAAVVVVGILLLVSIGPSSRAGQSATGSGSSTATTVTEVTGCCRAVPAAAQSAQSAMMALQVSTGHGVTQSCGVTVAPGGLVATTLDAVAGARSVTATTAGGRREPARIVATDRSSDIALVRVGGDPPVAQFADDASVTAGQPAMVMGVVTRPGHGTQTTTMWSDDTVRSVGAAVVGGDASGMAGIDAAARSIPAMAGEILLKPDGRVIGILDSTGSPRGYVFLPTQLVVGVADDLALSGRVRHGWLDVEGGNAPPGSYTSTGPSTTGVSSTTGSTATGQASGGALVVKVEPNGASSDVLRAGDVIFAVNSVPVRSMAELRSRLYVLGPGTQVQLGISREGTTMTVAVDLSASP